MHERLDENKPDETFLEAIKLGHLFFYDTETDEVVHLRKDIYEAAEENEDGLDLDLTPQEQEDAEDAWEIIGDDQGRFLAMPPIPEEITDEWEKEFQAAKLENWDEFCAKKIHAVLLDWLDSVDSQSTLH